ncbi:hypothetical protein JYG23_08685 [Sedimentibacter sp. zth1]|uniref:endonuclease/exonuclease/phosphatase family protein n=1 Tax=Sedimentibacter sp. zth1 TaxID=2816908 RepID=UPI001A9389DE|nr:hypothetical protein [Sedimentibacter sp. zth1]QSX04782.1 hypothetical protein JYG23_08685 [Sedimentibacter sp. zth1]
MILKVRMKEEAKKNIGVIKKHFFDKNDKITSGYIVGLAVENSSNISKVEWDNVIKKLFSDKKGIEAKSTSVSLRQEIYDKILDIQNMLQDSCGKRLYISQVIDVILELVANNLRKTITTEDSLTIFEWNINARTGSHNYIIPVNLIANEIFDKNPHIFVLTEFVKSIGWCDLKNILEKRYFVFESSYYPHQNGICIGVKKECGIELVKMENEIKNPDTGKDFPDFYEIKIKIKSEEISVIGTRIRIDCKKSNSSNRQERLLEQSQRFEQYKQLTRYIKTIDNVIVVGDFNNSRILGNEVENEKTIEEIYKDKDSIEHNFQKIRNFVYKESGQKISLYTATGNLSSIGAKCTECEAEEPEKNEYFINKYDHLLSNYFTKDIEYKWDFLRFYKGKEFFVKNPNKKNWEIAKGYPDHAVLIAKILLKNNG